MTIFKQYSSSSNAATGFIFSCLLFAMIFLTRRGAVYYWSILYYTMEAKLKNLRFFSHKNHEMKIVPENCRSLVDLFMCENFQNTAACSKRLLAGCFKIFFTSQSSAVLSSRVSFLPYFYVSISWIFLKFKDSFAMFWMQYSTDWSIFKAADGFSNF